MKKILLLLLIALTTCGVSGLQAQSFKRTNTHTQTHKKTTSKKTKTKTKKTPTKQKTPKTPKAPKAPKATQTPKTPIQTPTQATTPTPTQTTTQAPTPTAGIFRAQTLEDKKEPAAHSAGSSSAFGRKTSSKANITLAVYAAGGYSTFNYKLNTEGSASGKFGTDFGLSGTYWFTPRFGLQTGLSLATYKASLDIPTIKGSKDYGEGDDLFNYRYTISGYKDNVSAFYLNIPLLAQYAHPVSSRIDILGSGGVKLGIPLSAKYDLSTQDAATSGYYYYEAQEYTDVPENGFCPNLGAEYRSGKADFGLSIMLSLEAGVKVMLDNKSFAYAGLFFDYGVNNIQKGSGSEPIAFNPAAPEVPVYGDISSGAFVKSIRPMAIGLKLKFGIDL